MPSAPGYKRKYAQEKKTSDARGEKPERAARNRGRLIVKKKLGAAAIKGKDVDHKDRNTANNSTSNLTLKKPSVNRSVKGRKKA